MREEPIMSFVESEGHPIKLGNRDKPERIRETVIDLQLAIGGLAAQPPTQLADATSSFARSCSVFLRKMVLNDPRSPRLLDADICRKMGLRFGRFRPIRGDRRVLTFGPPGIAGGVLQMEKKDEETGEPERTEIVAIGPQRLSLVVQWPLIGMVDWLGQPDDAHPWAIEPEGLFGLEESLGCDAWLGQQLVLFDGRGITLKDVIRVTVNTEGAHSPPLDRVFVVDGSEDKTRFRVVKDGEIHILSHITVCELRYSHAIVIQSALHVYQQLCKHIRQQSVDVPAFYFVPDNAFGPDQSWLRFSGGPALALGGVGRSITFEIRAPG